MKTPVILLMFFLIFCPVVFADTIYFHDGSSLEGKIIGFEGSQVKIATPEGIINVDKYKVEKVNYDKEEDERLDEERPIGPGTPQWHSTW